MPSGITSLCGSAASSSLTSSEESALRRRVEQLSAQLAATEAALSSAQVQSSHWERCVHDLFNGLLLNPRMNARLELKVSKVLERALTKMENIETVRYVKCSFPSVKAEAPKLSVRRWTSLDESEWEMSFAPSWKIEICLEGRQILPFKILVRIGSIRVTGEMRVSFPPDLMHTLISFNVSARRPQPLRLPPPPPAAQTPLPRVPCVLRVTDDANLRYGHRL